MAEALALSAAVVFGVVHFGSGLLARRANSYAVALYGQFGGAVLVAVAALLVPATRVPVAALAWGALSGVGTGIGVAFLYRGLATGNMSVVAPLSDVAAVALPVLAGVVLFGDRPTVLAWIGVVAALPALWLVSRTGGVLRSTTATGTVDGLVAGVGFALQFVAISQVAAEAGLWPILAARLLAAVTVVMMARQAGAAVRLPRRLGVPASVIGAAGSVAIVLYLLATREQLLALATVLAALYPAIPVVLALVFLGERLSRQQVLGLALTGVAIALVSLG